MRTFSGVQDLSSSSSSAAYCGALGDSVFSTKRLKKLKKLKDYSRFDRLSRPTLEVLRNAGIKTADELAMKSSDDFTALSLTAAQIRSVDDRLNLVGITADNSNAKHIAEAEVERTALHAPDDAEPAKTLFALPSRTTDRGRPETGRLIEAEFVPPKDFTVPEIFESVTEVNNRAPKAKSKTDDERARAAAATSLEATETRPAHCNARVAVLRESATMNVNDAAFLYGVSKDVIYDMCKRNEIPNLRCGARIRIITKLVFRELGLH